MIKEKKCLYCNKVCRHSLSKNHLKKCTDKIMKKCEYYRVTKRNKIGGIYSL